MKYLGIDYGSKRIGVALSDDEGRLAFPEAVIPNNENAISTISDLIEGRSVGVVVIGESKNFGGQPNKIQDEIDRFAKKLEAREMDFEILFEPEFMTSVQAERGIQERRSESPRKENENTNEPNDASAAALILQSYLDRLNNK